MLLSNVFLNTRVENQIELRCSYIYIYIYLVLLSSLFACFKFLCAGKSFDVFSLDMIY